MEETRVSERDIAMSGRDITLSGRDETLSGRDITMSERHIIPPVETAQCLKQISQSSEETSH
jgi:hypothetical protein